MLPYLSFLSFYKLVLGAKIEILTCVDVCTESSTHKGEVQEVEATGKLSFRDEKTVQK